MTKGPHEEAQVVMDEPKQPALERILEYLGRTFPGSTPDASSCLDGLLADSLALMELIMFLEDEFGLRFARSDLDPANFATARAVCELVGRKQAGG